MIGLQAEKEPLRDAEISRDSQIRILSDRPLAEDDFIDAAWKPNGSSECWPARSPIASGETQAWRAPSFIVQAEAQ
ncbi:hypothetical protein MSC49_31620 [Methylosinus sp. C49]|nr:hypothetical protein MSC49_31620 [Methylosinus sp. C49]